jgi:hypothetical protein
VFIIGVEGSKMKKVFVELGEFLGGVGHLFMGRFLFLIKGCEYNKINNKCIGYIF